MILFPTTVHAHLVHCVTIQLYMISPDPQLHSAVFDHVFRFTVFGMYPTFVWPVKLFAVTHVFKNVYVAAMESVFVSISLTYHVLVMIPVVHCAGIVMPVIVPQVIPSKPYGVACNPAPVSFAPVMLNVPVVHSYQVALAKVNVGDVAS